MPITPSFQFYPGDFLSDRHTLVMTAEEVGMYCLLIFVCWEEESLPNDMEELADIARTPVKKFEAAWKRRLARCFVLNEKTNAYTHPRLDKIIKEIKAYRKKKSEAGKASGVKRRKTKEIEAEQVFDSVPTDEEQKATLLLLTSSPSPTSLSSPEEENTEGEVCVFDQSDEYLEFQNEILAGLRSDYKLNVLRDEQIWVQQIEWAFTNEFSAKGFLECFRLLRQQGWRTGRITPQNVADNLPELEKLRRSVHGDKPFDPGTVQPTEPTDTYDCKTCLDEQDVIRWTEQPDGKSLAEKVPCPDCFKDHRYDREAAA